MLRLCAVTLLVLVFSALVRSQPLPPAPIETVWEGMFPPPYLQTPQMGLSMDCVSGNLCYIGGSSNGAGGQVFKYDGQMNGQVTAMPMPNQSAMVWDIAVSGTEAQPTGVFTSVDLFIMLSQGLQYLANSGTEWLGSLIPLNFIWQSESVTVYKSDPKTFISVGTGIQNSIMMSNDAGYAFTSEPINYHLDDWNCSYPIGIATPSNNLWYLTWGAEPPQKNPGSSSSGSSLSAQEESTDVDSKYIDTANERIVGTKNFGRVLVIHNIKTGKTRVHAKTILEWSQDKKTVQKNNPVCNYYKGAILKSTDQGKTWTKIFEVPNMQTDFIKCYDEQHCTAIAYSNESTATITTQNGNDWKIAYVTPAPTQTRATLIQSVAYASQTDIWVGGNTESQTAAAGMFWFSNDSGVTFHPYPHTIPDVRAMMTLSCPQDQLCFSMGITMFQTSQIMRYKKQADYGNFIQSQCPVKGCNFLCQNISFPQGVCLSATGGSAKAFCTPQGVEQYIYQTTSCVGAYTKQMQPINQCLNGTNTFFENYCPGQGFSASGSLKASRNTKIQH